MKAGKLPSPARVLWSILHPRVTEAIRRTVFNFIQETIAFTRREIARVQRVFRRELAEGLAEGEALHKLIDRVEPLFGRERSYTIARTEAARAVEAGGLIAAQESGVVKAKRWLCAPGCCDRCRALDGKTVKLDEPFIVLPGVPAAYAVVMTGGTLHPNDRCSTEYILHPKYAP